MSLLVPKFHPFTWAALTAFYLLCLVCGGEANPDVAQAAWPLVAIGGALALGAVKEAIAAKRAKKDAEAAKAAEAKRVAGYETAMAPVVDPAKERLANPEQYTTPQATKRESLEETQKALDAQTRGEELEAKRGEGPYGSGKQFQMMDHLRKRRADALAGARLGIERQSDVLADAKKRADEGILTQYAGTMAGMAPTAQPTTPGIGEGLLSLGTSGITAAASAGLIPGGGGGGGTPPPTDSALDKTAASDPSSPLA